MSTFSIDFRWLERSHGSPVERSTLAELTIMARGYLATEVDDVRARTVRPDIRVSAHTLAGWFAANWWRLRWEPERNSLSWRLSHEMGTCGEGYLWPDLTFSSDGDNIFLHARASSPLSGEPIRYLNSFDVSVPATDFERGVDNFLDAVIGRLTSTVETDGLIDLWEEVREERRDPEIAAWRKLEAMMGCDPDEAPGALMAALREEGQKYGMAAVEEIAADSGQDVLRDIRNLCDGPRKEAALMTVPDPGKLRTGLEDVRNDGLLPWERAGLAARLARETWSLGPGPVENHRLADLFSAPRGFLEQGPGLVGPMNAGFRNGTRDTLSVFIRTPIPSNRRFALLRLVADHLWGPPEDTLLPATRHSRTQRQKFQRAFAQEFLCPYSELMEYFGSGEATDDAMEDAARHFDVSPLVVKTVLVNKGEVDRNRFGADLAHTATV